MIYLSRLGMNDVQSPYAESSLAESTELTKFELARLAAIVLGFASPSFIIFVLCWGNDHGTPKWLYHYFFKFIVLGLPAITTLVLTLGGMCTAFKVSPRETRFRTAIFIGLALGLLNTIATLASLLLLLGYAMAT